MRIARISLWILENMEILGRMEYRKKLGYDYSVLLNFLEVFLVVVFSYGSFKTKATTFTLYVVTKGFVREFLNVKVN